MVEKKGQDRVVEAVIDLIKSGERISLALLGGPLDTAFSERLRERIASESVGDSVKLLGQVGDTRPYIDMSDVVINSRIDAEPFGLSVVKAMLLERPVLAYALGGPSETVVDDETGWLIQDAGVESYKAGILRSLADRDRWESMGLNGARRARNRYSIEVTVRDYLNTVLGPAAKSAAQ